MNGSVQPIYLNSAQNVKDMIGTKIRLKIKMSRCYFCNSIKNIIITNLVHSVTNNTAPICHIYFNQVVDCLDGLEFQGCIIKLRRPNVL